MSFLKKSSGGAASSSQPGSKLPDANPGLLASGNINLQSTAQFGSTQGLTGVLGGVNTGIGPTGATLPDDIAASLGIMNEPRLAGSTKYSKESAEYTNNQIDG